MAGGFLFFQPMTKYEIQDGDLLISTDKSLLDRALIHEFLSQRSYWAHGLPVEVMNRSIEHSLCFGVYRSAKQVGFARMVTDFATFAWLADVFIVEAERGRGLGKKLVPAVLAHPDLQGLRRIMLGTRDAHQLYGKYGFEPLQHVERFMQIQNPNGHAGGSR
jgi:GNAT superfamily N-acetyltransferase